MENSGIIVNAVPGVSQMKSFIQVLFGDLDGAVQTQVAFINSGLFISQGRAAYLWHCGNREAAKKTQQDGIGCISAILDTVPVIGHIKGGSHLVYHYFYSRGCYQIAWRSLMAATRTSGVMGIGALVGLEFERRDRGSMGTFLGGIAGGFIMDLIITVLESTICREYCFYGHINFLNKLYHKDATSGDHYDAMATLLFDGCIACGAAGDVIGKNTKTTSSSSWWEWVVNDIDWRKILDGTYLAIDVVGKLSSWLNQAVRFPSVV